jgi:glycosyltransferase involved in cell wall biosynthesis
MVIKIKEIMNATTLNEQNSENSLPDFSKESFDFLDSCIIKYYSSDKEISYKIGCALVSRSKIDPGIQRNVTKQYDRIRSNLSFLTIPSALSNKYDGKRVAILGYVTNGDGWDPLSVNSGIAGSEEAIIYTSEELVRLGYLVSVYANPSKYSLWSLPCSNPIYKPADSFFNEAKPDRPFDIVIHWRNSNFDKVKAKYPGALIIYWPHDCCTYSFSVENLDACLFLSEYQRNDYINQIPKMSPIMYTMCGNGFDLSHFNDNDNNLKPNMSEENGGRFSCMYASSYSRGLKILLTIWPDVRREYPQATLDIYYGRETWGILKQDQLDEIVAMIVKLKNQGVREKGKIGHKALAEAFQRHSLLTYPCSDLSETYCITVVKSQAAGCIPVTTNMGALKETTRDGTPMITFNKDNILEDYKQLVLKTMKKIKELSKEELALERIKYQEFAKDKTWKNCVSKWEDLFNRLRKDID